MRERELTAKTHFLFRELNANIVALLDRFAGTARARTVEVHCECGRDVCSELLNLRRDEYEGARAIPTWFLIAPGHASPDVERVVEERERYAVVELTTDVVSATKRQPAGRQG